MLIEALVDAKRVVFFNSIYIQSKFNLFNSRTQLINSLIILKKNTIYSILYILLPILGFLKPTTKNLPKNN